jgi:hypothetical protein
MNSWVDRGNVPYRAMPPPTHSPDCLHVDMGVMIEGRTEQDQKDAA